MADPKETLTPIGYKKTIGGGDANNPGPKEFETDPGKKEKISNQPTTVADPKGSK